MNVLDLIHATGFSSGRISLALTDLEAAGKVESVRRDGAVVWSVKNPHA
jgi:uncharacterized membrane protein